MGFEQEGDDVQDDLNSRRTSENHAAELDDALNEGTESRDARRETGFPLVTAHWVGITEPGAKRNSYLPIGTGLQNK